ncbi:hypothetical protein PAXRUDRAFT_162220, partial [Paxillus rubicundulus Ve08.2h10]
MRHKVAKLSYESYKARALPYHPSHEEHRVLRNQYAEAIKETKKKHWLDWLEAIEGNELWIANKYISAAGGDGGPSKIPTLK